MFVADGRLLAISGKPYSCELFVGEVREPDRIVAISRLPGCTEGVALSADGREVAQVRQSDKGYRFLVRRVADRKRRFEVAVSATNLDVPRAYWSPDGRRLLSEFGGRTDTTVFNAMTGRRLRRITGGRGYLGRQPFSPDGRRVVVSDDRGARLTTVSTGRQAVVRVPDGLERPSWSPRAAAIAGVNHKGGVSWVDLATGGIRSVALLGVLEVAWSPDGRQLAAYGTGLGDERWSVSVIDTATAATTTIYRFAEGAEQGELAWSPDGTKLAFVVSEPV